MPISTDVKALERRVVGERTGGVGGGGRGSLMYCCARQSWWCLRELFTPSIDMKACLNLSTCGSEREETIINTDPVYHRVEYNLS